MQELPPEGLFQSLLYWQGMVLDGLLDASRVTSLSSATFGGRAQAVFYRMWYLLESTTTRGRQLHVSLLAEEVQNSALGAMEVLS